MAMRPIGIDTGGTKTRVAVDGEIPIIVPTPATKAQYLQFLSEQRNLLEGSFLVDAMAGPVDEDMESVNLTNKEGWGILTTDELREATGAAGVLIINDLEGVGTGVWDVLQNHPKRIVYVSGDHIPEGYQLVVAPGTGIGASKIAPDGEVLGGEGGWVLAQPILTDSYLIDLMQQRLDRCVACEDLAGNPALWNIWMQKHIASPEYEMVKSAADKPAKIAGIAKQQAGASRWSMHRVAGYLGQCAQSNMLSPPMARALCMVGSFEKDMEVPGYVDAFLESFVNSRHKELLAKAPVYTITNSGELGAMGSLAFARKYTER